MVFHRLATPGYFGGLPAGYDMINAGNAAADGAKVGAPNEGTYFIGFGEDATSRRFNRGLQALAQNTDALDDLLHRDLVRMTRTADVRALSVQTSITLPAGAYLGPPGLTSTLRNLALLFTIRDSNDRPIRDAVFGTDVTTVTVTPAGGDAIGGGFSANPVQLNTTSIPSGTNYRVYYGVRQSLATFDASTPLEERAFAMIYGHQTTMTRAHLASAIYYNGGVPWLDGTLNNTSVNVESQLDKILLDLVDFAGAARIGAAATTGSPHALSDGSVKDQLDALLGYVNLIHAYLNGTLPGAHISTGAFDDATLNGSTNAENLNVSGPGSFASVSAGSATFSSGLFSVLVDGTTRVQAAARLKSLTVDEAVTIGSTLHVAGTTTLTGASLVLTDAPVQLNGSSRIPRRPCILGDIASQTISVRSGDVFMLPNMSQDAEILINADSEVVGAWVRVTTLYFGLASHSVTVKNATGLEIVQLNSHTPWVDLSFAPSPIGLVPCWLIEALGYKP